MQFWGWCFEESVYVPSSLLILSWFFAGSWQCVLWLAISTICKSWGGRVLESCGLYAKIHGNRCTNLWKFYKNEPGALWAAFEAPVGSRNGSKEHPALSIFDLLERFGRFWLPLKAQLGSRGSKIYNFGIKSRKYVKKWGPGGVPERAWFFYRTLIEKVRFWRG